MSGANEVSAAVGEQPMPIPNDRPALWDLVIADLEDPLEGPEGFGLALKADMRARDLSGREKYHVPLQAFNGRDAFTDAYQEVLDGIVYTKQAMEETTNPALGLQLETIYEELLGIAIAFKMLLMAREVKP